MILDIILISVLIVCLITDLKYQKIYNKIIYPTLLAVIVIHITSNGFSGFKSSILGFIVGLSILLTPYFLGGIGAGDVKLLALIGAIKGSVFVLNTALYMALIGGIIALVIIVYKKELKNFFKTIVTWIFSLFNGIKYKIDQPSSSLTQKYPYGIAIVGGALICLFFKGAWII
ncbi:A24 family peptidase [Clostridium sp. DL1XJH146]